MVAAKEPRKRKAPQYQRFRYSKRIKHPAKLSSGWSIFKRSLRPIRKQWKLFLILIAIYAVLNTLLVHGLANSSNLPELKDLFDTTGQGAGAQLTVGFTLFGVLVGSTGGNSEAAGIYQSVLLVIMSLVFLWVLRSIGPDGEKKVAVKDGFYKGMYPVIPFLLVGSIIILQLIPLMVGASLYSIVVSNGLAVSGIEQLLWAVAFGFLALWSLYLIAPTLMALFVVTLPNMTPLKAYRSAKKMARYRRWTLLRKELFLPLIVVVLLAVLLVPLILWLTPAAEWVYLVLNVTVLPISISYLYTLYRELL